MMADAEVLKLQTRSMVGKLQILTASGELFNHVDSGGPMWSGDGDRRVEVAVTFVSPFSAVPHVTLGLTGVDSAHDQNLRLWLSARDVSVTGFTMVCETWGDTHIARAAVSWQALGSV